MTAAARLLETVLGTQITTGWQHTLVVCKATVWGRGMSPVLLIFHEVLVRTAGGN